MHEGVSGVEAGHAPVAEARLRVSLPGGQDAMWNQERTAGARKKREGEAGGQAGGGGASEKGEERKGSGEEGRVTRHRRVRGSGGTEVGEEKDGPFRLPEIRNVYASPVGAAGRVYITDRDGTTVVISHQDHPTVLARHRLDDSFSASAAVAGGALFLRGQRNLYCIAAE